MRLDKFLAHNGFGTRKDVKILVKKGMVTVNQDVVRDAGMVLNLEKDEVFVQGESVSYQKDIYFMMNKPTGYICEHNPEMYPSVLELIESYHRDLVFVGRLDADTEGLLLITNDGQFSHRVAHSKSNVHKQYYVELDKPFDLRFCEELEKGMMLGDELLKPAQVEVVGERAIHLTIGEGKYHQVKRMMHACDNEVTYLKRIKIGELELDSSLQPGAYRDLSEEEINLFIK
ncbi:pseudouridine synthase [Erysipelothrix rhusiopathiae]|nr:pseudouridine synthase [Erysipelothrix rhusiopathiae]MDE8323179.1 pseudouridine synthase [Erysipelothrix rhusiopathiae]